MEKITVGIEGLLLFNPKVFKDERGEFYELIMKRFTHRCYQE